MRRLFLSTNRFTLEDMGASPIDRNKVKLLYVSTAKYGGDWHSTLHTHACTEIFYVVGGGLMVAAIVLLVTKKRMENK